jgi:hypothetical protein
MKMMFNGLDRPIKLSKSKYEHEPQDILCLVIASLHVCIFMRYVLGTFYHFAF